MPARGELHVYRDSQAVARAVAELFVATGRMAAAERGAFRVALSGGNTPRAAYALLGQEALREELSWSDVFIYFGDERCVPPTDDQSNYRMAQQTFLDAVGIPHANVHRIRGEADPGQAANEYASILRADLGNAPRLDLMMLGLGSGRPHRIALSWNAAGHRRRFARARRLRSIPNDVAHNHDAKGHQPCAHRCLRRRRRCESADPCGRVPRPHRSRQVPRADRSAGLWAPAVVRRRARRGHAQRESAMID